MVIEFLMLLGQVCLPKPTVDEIKKAVIELKDIHESKAKLEVKDPIVIIRKYDGSIYVNGTQKVPLRAHLTIGKHIDRDLTIRVKTKVYERPKKPDPMFRLRPRFQIGVLLSESVGFLKGEKTAYDMVDAGISLDVFHIDRFNVAPYVGIKSIGGGVGMDLTRNFGSYVGYSYGYDEGKSGVMIGTFFAF